MIIFQRSSLCVGYTVHAVVQIYCPQQLGSAMYYSGVK